MVEVRQVFAGWQVKCRGEEAAVVAVSSRDLLVTSSGTAMSDAAEAQALLSIELVSPQRTHRFECEVWKLGWTPGGEELFRLAALEKQPFAELFRAEVLEPAVAGVQLAEPWRWCAAGAVGAIADLDSGGFVAEDPLQVFERFEAQHGAALSIDLVLGGELVTWVPALIIRGPKPGWAKVRTVSDEVGVPIRFETLATFILAHRTKELSWWREALRRTFQLSS